MGEDLLLFSLSLSSARACLISLSYWLHLYLSLPRIHLQNDDEQQRILIDILKQKHPRTPIASSSAVSTPMMVRRIDSFRRCHLCCAFLATK